VSLESFILFLIIFMWTPPHFWALALFKSGDYRAAGIPMLPVVAGEDATRTQILLYSLVLVPIAVSPWFLGFAGVTYGIASAVLGAGFLGLALQVYRLRTGEAARKAAVRLFSYSILYLFLLFALLLGESLVTRMI
jgi:protoheme IX farnesyltransferase